MQNKKDVRQSEKDLKTYIANKTKSNPKEFYSYVCNKKVITINTDPVRLENSKVTNKELEMAKVSNAFIFTIQDNYEI